MINSTASSRSTHHNDNPAASQLLDYKQQNAQHAQPHNTAVTTSQGAPIDSLTSSMTAGPKGPIVLQDFTLIDHLSHFDRERIPERVVHAKGAGAFGYFELTHVQPQCRASIFQHFGHRTPVAVRFSTVGGESGSADTARDPRGFAVKFYTDQGNWDLVGNNTPIFFIRDPILFPSFIHTQKRNPQTHLPDANMFWDFISLRPETVHQVSFLFADRGIPDGYRFMNGYGSHTFKNVSTDGTPCYVKYHWKTNQGIRNLTAEQAQNLASKDPNYAIRDLYNAIAQGNFPSWTLYVQIMPYEQAHHYHKNTNTTSFDPFDLTQIWPQKQFPLYPVGRMVLNQNPTNYFAQVEQLAFSPSHMIPGIEPSPDKMLQARLFSYPDTHRHRLGTNYTNIPVNRALCPIRTYQRDGPMQTGDNGSNAPHYFPNSFGGPTMTTRTTTVKEHGDDLNGSVARVETFGTDETNFAQCRVFYKNVLNDAARERLTDNLAQHISQVTEPTIRQRTILLFTHVDPEYGATIARKMKPLLEMTDTRMNPLDTTSDNRLPQCPYRSRL